MKKLIFVTILFLTCSYGYGQIPEAVNGQRSPEKVVTDIQAELIFEKSKVFPDQTQLSFAIIENGEVKYYAIKREKDTIKHTNNHTRIFEIGSLSKVFTATLLADFVVEGKLEQDEPINQYIEISINDDIQITFKELASHTSGLPRLPTNLNLMFANPQNPYEQYDEEKLEEYLADQLQVTQSGEKQYDYSNLGAGLLGYILSKMENTTYENLLQNRIFSEYGMTSSTTQRAEIEDRMVTGLDDQGNQVPNWDLAALMGAGGILSTVEDLSQFAVAQFNDSDQTLKLTRQPIAEINDNMAIGLGWHIIQTGAGNGFVWHNGGTGGYSSSMAVDPENKNGIVILSNVSSFNGNARNIDQLCFELLATLKKE